MTNPNLGGSILEVCWAREAHRADVVGCANPIALTELADLQAEPSLRTSQAHLTAKNRQLVPEHEDLQLLRAITATEEHDQLEQPAHDEVQQRHEQGVSGTQIHPSCCSGVFVDQSAESVASVELVWRAWTDEG
jgi:hypothetical protein